MSDEHWKKCKCGGIIKKFIANKKRICDNCRINILKGDSYFAEIKQGRNHNTINKILCSICYDKQMEELAA